jgi:hypothetical protein
MKARNKRIIFVIVGLRAIGAAGALITSALQKYNLLLHADQSG